MKIMLLKSIKDKLIVLFTLFLFLPISVKANNCYDMKTHDMRMDCLIEKMYEIVEDSSKRNSERQKLMDNLLNLNVENGNTYKSTDSMKKKLNEVKELYEDNIITEREYQALRSKIISSFK